MPILYKVYSFRQMVGPVDWIALPRVFNPGEKVEKFIGHTYGLDRDDMMYGGVETIPCMEMGSNRESFFTVPVKFLEDENGKSPMGDYQVFEKVKK